MAETVTTDRFEPDAPVRTRSLRIGCIGAGMIMAECHLAAYRRRAFRSSPSPRGPRRTRAKVAERWGIPTVHDTPEALIADPEVEIVDLAFPPDQQPALIRAALEGSRTSRGSSRRSRWR